MWINSVSNSRDDLNECVRASIFPLMSPQKRSPAQGVVLSDQAKKEKEVQLAKEKADAELHAEITAQLEKKTSHKKPQLLKARLSVYYRFLLNVSVFVFV